MHDCHRNIIYRPVILPQHVDPLLNNDSVKSPVARQQIPNKHQWTNRQEVFSMRTVRQMCDATIEELLGWCFLCNPCRSVISRTSLEFS
jgi:hypothetical protein